jgi:hypothetical protein
MAEPMGGPPGDLVGLRGCQMVGYATFAADTPYFLGRAYGDRVSVDVEIDGEPFVTVVKTEEYEKLVRLAAWAEVARKGGD